MYVGKEDESERVRELSVDHGSIYCIHMLLTDNCIYTHARAHTHVQMHTCTYTLTYMHTYVHEYIHAHIHAFVHVSSAAYILIWGYTCPQTAPNLINYGLRELRFAENGILSVARILCPVKTLGAQRRSVRH